MQIWVCKDCQFQFGAPMIDTNYNTDESVGRCPYCGSKNIQIIS